LRFSTATCWRKASTSSAVSLRVRNKTQYRGQEGADEWEHDSPL
jgi:hypothetical protein